MPDERQDKGPPETAPGKVPIIIDGQRMLAPRRRMTGMEIRQLLEPPIPSDRDLWRDADGDLDDLVEDSEPVDLFPQTVFFTVPRVINPG